MERHCLHLLLKCVCIWISYPDNQQSDHAVLITSYRHNHRVSFFSLIMQSRRVGGKLATNNNMVGDVTVQLCGLKCGLSCSCNNDITACGDDVVSDKVSTHSDDLSAHNADIPTYLFSGTLLYTTA